MINAEAHIQLYLLSSRSTVLESYIARAVQQFSSKADEEQNSCSCSVNLPSEERYICPLSLPDEEQYSYLVNFLGREQYSSALSQPYEQQNSCCCPVSLPGEEQYSFPVILLGEEQ